MPNMSKLRFHQRRGHYNLVSDNDKKMEEQSPLHKKDTGSRKFIEIIKSIYYTIKGWFGSSPSPVLDEKINSIMEVQDSDNAIQDLADIMKEIAEQKPSMLQNVSMKFNETTRELIFIFGGESPISYYPNTEVEDNLLQEIVALSKDHPTIESHIEEYRESMERDYRREGSGVRIFTGSEVYDVNKMTSKISEEKQKLPEKGGKDNPDPQENFLSQESKKIVQHVGKIYTAHIGEINESRAVLDGLSSQAGLADLLKMCISELSSVNIDNNQQPLYSQSDITRTVDIYQISQQTFYLDVGININNISFTDTSNSVPSKHRFQIIISPDSFHVIGKQHDLSKFPEYASS